MVIRKRDGRIKPYAIERIVVAITKAYEDVYGVVSLDANNVINAVVKDVDTRIKLTKKETVDIEEIQDIVQKTLYKHDRKVHKAYKEYREKRTRDRENRGYINTEIEAITNQTSEEITNNANKDGKKIQSLRAMYADIVCKDYNKRNIIPKELLDKHEKELYIHDLNYFGQPFYNCCLINWEDMLKNGFHIGTTHICNINSFATAIALLAQIVSHVASNCYGGVTLPKAIKGLVPYAKISLNKYREIAKHWSIDDVEGYAFSQLEKELKDGAQSFEYEVATLTTARAEVPFITLGIDVGIIDGDEEDIKLSRMITKAFLQQRINGLTGGVTPVFPKLTYQNLDGVNLKPEDVNYDLFQMAIKCSALRGYPDYINTKQCEKVTGGYKEPMGCRSFLPEWTDENGNVKYAGRFNYAVVSINLPRLAIQSNGDIDDFFKRLDVELDNCKKLIMIRYDVLKDVTADQAPILYMEGAIARMNEGERIEPLLNNGYSTVSIGYIGIHNTVKALLGKSFIEDDKAYELGERIMSHLKEYADIQKKETGIGFSVYSTPFEAGAYKLCTNDVKDFGIIEGVNDNEYYENSYHYPSNTEVSPFHKLSLESPYSEKATGGAISFVELGDMTKNLKALEDIVRYSYDKTHFLGISTISDRCLECGYIGEIGNVEGTFDKFICPKCGNTNHKTMSVIRKLCGYLGSLSERPTVRGKMKEISNRKDNLV